MLQLSETQRSRSLMRLLPSQVVQGLLNEEEAIPLAAVENRFPTLAG